MKKKGERITASEILEKKMKTKCELAGLDSSAFKKKLSDREML